MPEVIQLGEFVEKRKDGKEIKFRVQTAPLEMTEEVVDFMTKFFLPREPMCSSRILPEPLSVKTLQDLWRDGVRGGTSLIALEIKEDQKPKLIGSNVTPISEKKGPPELNKEVQGEGFCDVIEALIDFAERGNIFEKYGVDRYITGYGLTVDSDYHGFNVGQRLLECRKPLCEKLGIKATGTVFTASSSQYIANKVGFETLAEAEYPTYTVNGKKPFASLKGKMVMSGWKF